jgi:peptide/nickel transport system permease protein
MREAVAAAPPSGTRVGARGAARGAARVLLRHRGATAGLIVVALVAVVGLAPGMLAPHDPDAQDLLARLNPPGTPSYVLGTDTLGRDLLSRLIWGARVSLAVSVLAVAASMLVGTGLGLAAGFFGGASDLAIMRGIDILMAFPSILLALVVVGVLGGGLINLIAAIAISGMPHFGRLARGEALALREQAFVEAARATGASNLRVLMRHVLRNAVPPLVVLGSLRLSTAILTESSLSFLGLGVSPPTATWGGTVADGMRFMQTAPWIPLGAGFTIMITVLAFNLLGDGIRDVLDPRLRNEAGRRAE